ncbi:hypothetical protein [Frigoriglobus tundricola]|uniref:DUF2029 domain-containing protein n=1 Tax=Frigoriglobus tundricola TaxID=2774151 RepID=A0A6M5Z059_9BACT|nr:hypothetical protein [Frigoriglobus tundricola]QJW99096.1 hypothetical protein FTUN_6694 [Frigoriglobus tundricola]
MTFAPGAFADPARAVRTAGIATVGLYLVAAVFFTLAPGTPVAKVTEPFRWLLITGLLVTFATGYRAVHQLPETTRLRRQVIGYGAALAAAAVLVPAFQSTDLYVYVNIGWQQIGYGMDPYRSALFETPNWQSDPMFVQEWPFVPCSYGFLFALETRAVCALSGPNHALAVVGFKAIALATYFALGAVVWTGYRVLERPNPIRGLYLVLWNPLLLLHCVSNAHNDLQFALGVAVAIVGFARGRWLIVFPALAVAALVKYLSVILVPFFLVASVRRFGWVRVGLSGAVALALAVACWWPYRTGFDESYLSRTGSNHSTAHYSLASIAVFSFEIVFKGETREWLAGPFYAALKAVCLCAFTVLYLAALVRVVRTPRERDAGLASASVFVLLGIILTSPKFHSWYLGMVLPLAVWLPIGSRTRRLALAMGVSNLLSFTFVYQSHLLNALLMHVVPLVLVFRDPPGPADRLRGVIGRSRIPRAVPGLGEMRAPRSST